MNSESDILERRDFHLLIIDDDDRIRSLLKTYLSRHGYRISTAANAQEARHLIKSLAYDLLILDVMMPGEDGFSLTQSLRKKDDVPIILLTAKGDSDDRIAGFRVGADDYLSKPFEPEELLLRIEALFRRIGSRAPTSTVQFGPWTFDLNRLTLTKAGEPVRLTTGEEALLTLLARRSGAPVSRYALSEKIRAKSDRAVDVQMTRLRRKIETNPAEPLYLLTVRGHGYRLLIDTPN